MTDTLLDALKRMQVVRTGYLFRNAEGEPMTDNEGKYHCYRLCRLAGLPESGFHGPKARDRDAEQTGESRPLPCLKSTINRNEETSEVTHTSGLSNLASPSGLDHKPATLAQGWRSPPAERVSRAEGARPGCRADRRVSTAPVLQILDQPKRRNA